MFWWEKRKHYQKLGSDKERWNLTQCHNIINFVGLLGGVKGWVKERGSRKGLERTLGEGKEKRGGKFITFDP